MKWICVHSFVVQFVVTSALCTQQLAATDYNPTISNPAYEKGKGPLVVIDEAHHNFHTADERYATFANVLKSDGFRVEGFKQSFSAESLKDVDVLVISNALHESNLKNWELPTPSAFTKEEIHAVTTWVKQGGSLFIIADHMPFPGAADDLAKAFGFEFSNGYARSPKNRANGLERFDAESGLQSNAITKGRNQDEEVTHVGTFGGSAFKPPKDAIAILKFGAEAKSYETTKAPGISDDAKVVDVEGWCQGAVMNYGNGRLAVFGEAAMFSAQTYVQNEEVRMMGMNHPDADHNYRLLLNILHWLSNVDGLSNE